MVMPASTVQAGAQKGAAEAERFLQALFGDETPGYLTIFTAPPPRTRWFPADDPGAAAKAGTALSDNVYFSVCPQKEELGGGKRGSRESVIAMPGLWFDLDIQDEAHKQNGLPASEAEAMEFVESLPHPPTIVVHSGRGLHLYWLFEEPWILEDDAARQRAQRASRRLQKAIIEQGKARGWTLDNTADLARVLRLPGTLNRKREPHVPVRVLSWDGDRYALDDLVDASAAPTASPRARDGKTPGRQQQAGEDEPLPHVTPPQLAALSAPGGASDRVRWTEEVVAAIANDERFDRNAWIGVAHAIRASCGRGFEDEAKRIFIEFSDRWTAGDATPEEAESRWATLGPTTSKVGYRRLLNWAGDAYEIPEGHPWHPSSDLVVYFSTLSSEAAYETTAAQIEHVSQQPPQSADFLEELILAERMIRALPSGTHQALARALLLYRLEDRLGRHVHRFLTKIERSEFNTEEAAFATLDELLAEAGLLEPPPCVVPRLAYRGRTTLLAGPDKSGKSTLMAHAAAAVSRSDSFLGEQSGEEHGGRIVWAGLEESLGDAVRRFSDLDADPENVRLIRSPDAAVHDHIRKALREEAADLVVIDSLIEYARLVGGEAPKSGDDAAWANVMRPLVALSREFDVAVVVLHHTRKSDGQYRGSTEIAAAVDALLEISMPSAADDSTVRRISGRGRDAMAVEPFAITFGPDGYELSDGAELPLKARIIVTLRENPGLSQNKLRDAVEARTEEVREAAVQLMAAGIVVNRGKQSRWKLYLKETAQEEFEVVSDVVLPGGDFSNANEDEEEPAVVSQAAH